MKKYISTARHRYGSIFAESNNLRSGDFRYPIISAMDPADQHIKVITLGYIDSNFDDIKDNIVALGITAGYTNVVLDGKTEDQMTGIFEYIVNDIYPGDELVFDIGEADRYIKFALLLAAKYVNIIAAAKNIDQIPVMIIDNENSVVRDVTNDYKDLNIMQLTTILLKNSGLI